jgi:hypothetical protein
MSASFGTCPKHQIKYRGRCPRCHPRRSSSSRPVSGRRQHALVTERLFYVETARAPERRYVTTFDAASRWLNRNGKTWAELTDPEYGWLFERSTRLADRWNRVYGRAELEAVR